MQEKKQKSNICVKKIKEIMQCELNVAGGSLEAASNLDQRKSINYLNTPSKK